MHQWQMSKAGSDSVEELPALPAAQFGNIEFPNIVQLAAAGLDCIAACSSTGSVALWNHARSPFCNLPVATPPVEGYGTSR